MIAPRYEMGAEAARLLFERMEGAEEEPKRIFMRVHMAVRDSTMNSATKRLDVMFDE